MLGTEKANNSYRFICILHYTINKTKQMTYHSWRKKKNLFGEEAPLGLFRPLELTRGVSISVTGVVSNIKGGIESWLRSHIYFNIKKTSTNITTILRSDRIYSMHCIDISVTEHSSVIISKMNCKDSNVIPK